MNQEKWDTSDIQDQKGRIAVVTGSSSGIGYETARVLAIKNAKVIIAVRSLAKGQNAKNQIIAQYKDANIDVMRLDLADIKSVKSFAEEFKKEHTRLDLLINNAGVMMPPYSKTKDGFELQFGTNHLGHFLLTALLFDLIKNTIGSRIINISSSAHKAGDLDFGDLNWENRKYNKWKSYGDSKIANIYFTIGLSKKLSSEKNAPTLVAD
jgi:NAD(P)-dependent dehydrogenase (short-subunit alcohol dehydrogenase family)